jgi:hypothetical protein
MNLPRPENTIAKGDKTHLWDVQLDDEVVMKAKQEISSILNDNLKVVE